MLLSPQDSALVAKLPTSDLCMSGRYSIFLLLFILQSSCVLSLHCLESPYQTNHETTSNDINRILALWSRTNGTEFCHAEIIFTVGGTYNLTDCYYFGINADIEYGHATLGLNASQADNKVTLVAAPSLGHFSIFMESNLFATHVWFQVSISTLCIPVILNKFPIFVCNILILYAIGSRTT